MVYKVFATVHGCLEASHWQACRLSPSGITCCGKAEVARVSVLIPGIGTSGSPCSSVLSAVTQGRSRGSWPTARSVYRGVVGVCVHTDQCQCIHTKSVGVC